MGYIDDIFSSPIGWIAAAAVGLLLVGLVLARRRVSTRRGRAIAGAALWIVILAVLGFFLPYVPYLAYVALSADPQWWVDSFAPSWLSPLASQWLPALAIVLVVVAGGLVLRRLREA
jgi:hypothetical protein